MTILDKFEEIKNAECKLEILKKEYADMWEDAFPKQPDYEFDKISVCPSCGLALGGDMSYLCNREKCPTGLGGVYC